MRTNLIIFASAMMLGSLVMVGGAHAQTTNSCGGTTPCANGVPPAAAGGQGGSGPIELRKTPMDSPVGTGAGGGGDGGGDKSGSASK